MKSNVEQLERELKKAESTHQDVPRQLEELKVKADKLRARRTELLNACGFGEIAAIEEVNQIEKKLKEMAHQELRVLEINLELNHSVNSLDVKLLRALIKEEQGNLSKLEDALNAGLKTIAKAIAEIDFSRIKTATRYFSGEAQVAEQRLRDEIGNGVSATVAALLSDPTRPPVINVQPMERVLKALVEACDLRDEELQRYLFVGRQEWIVRRRRLEPSAAI